MNERRVARRFPVEWPVRLGHRTAGAAKGKAINISSTGMLFWSDQAYTVTDMTEMEVTIAPCTHMQAVIRIVRDLPVIPGSEEARRAPYQYRYAARFMSMRAESKLLLGKVLTDMLQKSLADRFGATPARGRAA